MKYTGTTWRPPFEAFSLLLQVTAGCSHNRCAFCSMYRDVPFAVEPMEQIEADLLEARETHPRVERVFLVNADPFCLSGRRLKTIAEKIIEHLPEVKSIGMYASIQNIVSKSDEELKVLRRLRISGLNVGLESGLPEVLDELDKGFSLEEARFQLTRLKQAGISFSVNIIIGAAGGERHRQNALASAKMVNEVEPDLIFVATLHLENESPLRNDLLKGVFKENTLRETIEEERLFLENLKLEGTQFFGRHPSNAIPLDGTLSRDKKRMLQALEDGLRFMSSKHLDVLYTRLVRGREGAIQLS